MSKLVKDYITSELRGRYGEVENAVLVEYFGVNGELNTNFRRDMRKRKIQLEIVSNSLLRRAIAGTKLDALTRSLKGPSALVTGGDSAIDAAKALKDWAEKVKGLKLKAAVLEGEFIDEHAVAELHSMPTKRDLQGRVVGQMLSPGGKLASILSGGGNIAGSIKALIEKLEKGEAVGQTA